MEYAKEVKAFKSIQEDMLSLYARKNQDYGSAVESGMEKLGNNYIAVILYNKVERLINLANRDKEDINFESLRDTLFDIGVYATEACRVIDKQDEERENAKSILNPYPCKDEAILNPYPCKAKPVSVAGQEEFNRLVTKK